MASEAVKKILSAEADSDRKISDARKRSDDIIAEAERYSAIAVQKKISVAASESEKIRDEYRKKAEIHARQAERECIEKIGVISALAEKNMNNAVNAVIDEFF
ncbi:MAG: hypothetical protein J6B74_01930 [Ruminococcus sp.]|nr:hypothetical protein [Ruminococcus sp.]